MYQHDENLQWQLPGGATRVGEKRTLVGRPLRVVGRTRDGASVEAMDRILLVGLHRYSFDTVDSAV